MERWEGSCFTEAEEVSKLRVEVEERNKQLQTLANGLSAENWELRNRMAQVELANTKREQKIAALEQKLVEVERVLAELKGLLQNVEEEQKT